MTITSESGKAAANGGVPIWFITALTGTNTQTAVENGVNDDTYGCCPAGAPDSDSYNECAGFQTNSLASGTYAWATDLNRVSLVTPTDQMTTIDVAEKSSAEYSLDFVLAATYQKAPTLPDRDMSVDWCDTHWRTAMDETVENRETGGIAFTGLRKCTYFLQTSLAGDTPLAPGFELVNSERSGGDWFDYDLHFVEYTHTGSIAEVTNADSDYPPHLSAN